MKALFVVAFLSLQLHVRIFVAIFFISRGKWFQFKPSMKIQPASVVAAILAPAALWVCLLSLTLQI